MPTVPRFRGRGNHLLDRLPALEFEAMESSLQRVEMTLKQVVHESEAEVTDVYFPTTMLASLLTVLEDNETVEALTVGREGFLGLAAALGVGASPHRVICQLPGETLRMPVGTFLEALEYAPELRRTVNRYLAFVLRSSGQSLACNAVHPVEARASRWLLIVHDQAGRDDFPMTHEFLAYMLGVRRPTVTVVAGALQRAGMIGYRRGVVSVLNRALLEDAACGCYGALRTYYDRVVK